MQNISEYAVLNNHDASFQSSLANMVKKVRMGVGKYYLVLTSQPQPLVSAMLHRIGIIIQLLQSLMIVFVIKINWGSSFEMFTCVTALLNLIPSAGYFSYNYENLEAHGIYRTKPEELSPAVIPTMIGSSTFEGNIPFYIVLGGLSFLVVMFVITFALVIHNIHINWALKLMRLLLIFFSSVGLLPVLHNILPLAFCPSFAVNSLENCLVFRPIGYLLIALFFFIILLEVASDYNPLYDFKSQKAKANTRLDVLYLISKVIIVSLFTMSVTFPSPFYARQGVLWTLVIIHFLMHEGYIIYQPWYIRENIRLWAWGQILISWAAFVAIVIDLQMSEDNNIRIAFMWTLPIVLLYSALHLDMRSAKVLMMPTSEITSPVMLELHVRLKLLDTFGVSIECELSAEKLKKIQTLLNTFTQGGGNSSTSSYTYNAAANLICTFQKQRALYTVISYLSKVDLSNPAPDTRFSVWRTRCMLSQLSDDIQGPVIAFLESEKFTETALNFDRSACIALISFWTELRISQPQIERLSQKAEDVSHNIRNALRSYRELIQSVPDSAKPMEAFSGFLNDVVNDKEKANQYRLDAKAAENRMNEKGAKQQDFLSLLHNKNVGVIIVGGKPNTGEILFANAYVCNLLGYTSSQFSGRNINVIVPTAWRATHDEYLIQFSEYGGSRFLRESGFILLAVTKSDHLIPVQIIMLAYNPTITLIRYVATVQTVNTIYHYAMVDPAGRIRGYTEGLSEYFEYTPPGKASHYIDYFTDPEFQDMVQRLLDERPPEEFTSLLTFTTIGVNNTVAKASIMLEPLNIVIADVQYRWLNFIIRIENTVLPPSWSESTIVKLGLGFTQLMPLEYRTLIRNISYLPDPNTPKAKEARKEILVPQNNHVDVEESTEVVKELENMVNEEAPEDNPRDIQIIAAIRKFRELVIYGNSEDKGMQLFRRLFYAVMFLSIAIAVLFLLTARTEIKSVEEKELFLVDLFSQRNSSAEILLSTAYLLSSEQEKLSMSPLKSDLLISSLRLRDNLVKHSGIVEQLDRQVYTNYRINFSQDQHDLYKSTPILLNVLRGEDYTTISMPLWDATKYLIQSVRTLANTTLDRVSITDTSIFFILSNMLNSYVPQIHTGGLLFKESIAATLKVLEITLLVKLICTCITLILLTVIVVRPLLSRIDNDKVEVLKLFVDMDRDYVKKLSDAMQKRLDLIHNFTSDENPLEEDDFTSDLFVNRASLNTVSNLVTNQNFGDEANETGNKEIVGPKTPNSSSSSSPNSSTKSSSGSSSSSSPGSSSSSSSSSTSRSKKSTKDNDASSGSSSGSESSSDESDNKKESKNSIETEIVQDHSQTDKNMKTDISNSDNTMDGDGSENNKSTSSNHGRNIHDLLQQLWDMIKLSGIFITSLIYFITQFFLSYRPLRTALLDTLSIINWTTYLDMTTRMVSVGVLELRACTQLQLSFMHKTLELRRGLILPQDMADALEELNKYTWACNIDTKKLLTPDLLKVYNTDSNSRSIKHPSNRYSCGSVKECYQRLYKKVQSSEKRENYEQALKKLRSIPPWLALTKRKNKNLGPLPKSNVTFSKTLKNTKILATDVVGKANCISGDFCESINAYCQNNSGVFNESLYLIASNKTLSDPFNCLRSQQPESSSDVAERVICQPTEASRECCSCNDSGFCKTEPISKKHYAVENLDATCGNLRSGETCIFSKLCRSDISTGYGSLTCNPKTGWYGSAYCELLITPPLLAVFNQENNNLVQSITTVGEKLTAYIEELRDVEIAIEFGDINRGLRGTQYYDNEALNRLNYVDSCDILTFPFWSTLEDGSGVGTFAIFGTKTDLDTPTESQTETTRILKNKNNSKVRRIMHRFIYGLLSLSDSKPINSKYDELNDQERVLQNNSQRDQNMSERVSINKANTEYTDASRFFKSDNKFDSRLKFSSRMRNLISNLAQSIRISDIQSRINDITFNFNSSKDRDDPKTNKKNTIHQTNSQSHLTAYAKGVKQPTDASIAGNKIKKNLLKAWYNTLKESGFNWTKEMEDITVVDLCKALPTSRGLRSTIMAYLAMMSEVGVDLQNISTALNEKNINILTSSISELDIVLEDLRIRMDGIGEKMAYTLALSEHFILDMQAESVNIYKDMISQLVSSKTYNVSLYFLFAYIFCMILVYVSVQRPLMLELEDKVRMTRSMLLIIPEELLLLLKNFRGFLMKFILQQGIQTK